MTEPSGPSSTPASSTSTATAQAPIAASNPTPVVHLGIVCDVCNEIVEGVRHKCLDCPGPFTSISPLNLSKTAVSF